ncbi:DnaJ domain-containing protein [Mycoplasma sp. Pen4]|uniref:DnaJ domain-containing protein n=1 Tax=Mycoplasma sp. Pen4 TaxID=640330 RepID=UPI001654954F|nr:DnaJ domain-containing protein [Mycoplasma sp. Pen4]QNM93929.1 DnaJ domain-containing protein [Mycoplasma sp. Pen4]
MSKKRDYYEVLGVPKTATEKEIKTAYRSLAKKYHPDVVKDGSSDEKMREINEAYDILSDAQKRKIYDTHGHDAANNMGGGYSASDGQGFEGFGGFGGGFNFHDIFDSIFSGMGGGSSRSGYSTEDFNIVENIEIKFMDGVNGIDITKKLNKYEACLDCHAKGAKTGDYIQCSSCKGQGYVLQQARTFFGVSQQQVLCPSCKGSGITIVKKCTTCDGQRFNKVQKNVLLKVPKGTNTDGVTLRLKGFGRPIPNTNKVGDYKCHIIVRPHKYWKYVSSVDLAMEYQVSIFDIIKEANIEIPTPLGRKTIKLKSSYKTGTKIKIRGGGVDNSYRQGDLYLHLDVIVPHLSRADKKTILTAAESITDETNNEFIKEIEKAK